MANTKRKGPAIGRPIEATPYARYESYAYFQAAPSPLIPIRSRRLEELSSPDRLVLPQFFQLVPFNATVPAATPLIPFQTRRLEELGLVLPPISAGHFQLLTFQAQPAQANLVIPIQTRELAELREPRFTQYSSFNPYSYTDIATPGAANPLIGFRVRSLFELRDPAFIARQSAYGSYTFLPTYPVIAYAIGQWVGDAVQPKLVQPFYLPFPYWRPPVPPSPVISPRIRPLEELRYEVPLPRSGFFVFPYKGVQPPASNPVIPYRSGQWLGDAIIPLVGIQGYQEFPWVSTQIAPTNPVIPLRTRPLSELRAEEPLPRSGFFTLVPYARIAPIIQFTQGQWIEMLPTASAVRTGYFTFIAPPPAARAFIPYLRGQWIGELVQPRTIDSHYQWFPVVPEPARPVILYCRGQWLGDQVQPLVGIHGYYAFPWISPVPPVGEPYRTVEAADRAMRFEAKGRAFIMELDK